MNHRRAGGLLCLLLVTVAAVLPMGALAQVGDAPDESVLTGAGPSNETGAVNDTAEEEAGVEELPPGDVEEGVEDLAPEGSEAGAEDLAPEGSEAGTEDLAPEGSEEPVAEDLLPPEGSEAGAEDLAPEESEEPVAEDLAPDGSEEVAEDLVPPEPVDEAPMMDAPMEDAPREDVPLAEAALAAAVSDLNSSEENETVEEEMVEENETEEEEVEEELSETDRIWREGNNPATYTWTPQTFSGFFYDLDDDVGTETLTVHLRESGGSYDRSIREDELEYVTRADSITYEFSDWGQYQVIGFMAQKYFAGYEGTDSAVVSKGISLLDEEELHEVLIDDDQDYTVDTGSVLPLGEGYELRIKEIDLDGNKVWLALAKDGSEVDSRVVDPTSLGSSTYKYEADLRGDKFPLVMAHVGSIFRGAETSLVTIDGLFQISDKFVTVASGDTYGSMEVDSISGNTIRMANDRTITLRMGRTVPVMGDVSFLVADASELRFAPTVKRTGSYEIRGTIVDPAEGEFTWTPYNFEGFYYDIDDDVGTETLTARFSGERIADGDLTYGTYPQSVPFEYAEWGSYNVIGFLAEKYFAGYNSETVFTKEFSLINEGQLRKVLIDDDQSYTVRSGTTFPLKEGYELRIKEVDLDGNKIFLSITKDGEEVDSKVVEPGRTVTGSTFTYEERISGERVPIVAVHVQSVFRGREEDLATIEGIFQISDTPRSVEEGETYDKMEIDSVSDSGIVMKNDGSISLGRGRTVSIMENMMFRIADSDQRLVVPIVEVKADLKPMTLGIPQAVVGTPAEIRATSEGAPIIGAIITIDGEEVGTTTADGIYLYTPPAAGSFEISAKRDEYTEVKGVLVVSEVAEERILAVTAPQEVMKGESFVIKATIGVDLRPVEGADIGFENVTIGTTDSLGTFSYASDSVGSYTITASKEGYESGSRRIVVASPIRITGIEMPETVRAGKTVEITATAENPGAVSDTTTLELRVNGVPEGTMELTVAPGETGSAAFEYQPLEPGLYTVEVRGIQRTLTVEEKSSAGTIVGILVILFALGGGAYLYSTGRLNEMLGQIKNR